MAVVDLTEEESAPTDMAGGDADVEDQDLQDYKGQMTLKSYSIRTRPKIEFYAG